MSKDKRQVIIRKKKKMIIRKEGTKDIKKLKRIVKNVLGSMDSILGGPTPAKRKSVTPAKRTVTVKRARRA